VRTPSGPSDEHTHTHTHTHRENTCWLAHNHHRFFSLTPPSGFFFQVAIKGRKKTLCQIKKLPLPFLNTHHFCQRGGLPSPAVALSSLPSNNHDLHALPVRPLLLRERERERKKKRKSNKRPQMDVGHPCRRAEGQRDDDFNDLRLADRRLRLQRCQITIRDFAVVILQVKN